MRTEDHGGGGRGGEGRGSSEGRRRDARTQTWTDDLVNDDHGAEHVCAPRDALGVAREERRGRHGCEWRALCRSAARRLEGSRGAGGFDMSAMAKREVGRLILAEGRLTRHPPSQLRANITDTQKLARKKWIGRGCAKRPVYALECPHFLIALRKGVRCPSANADSQPARPPRQVEGLGNAANSVPARAILPVSLRPSP